MTVAAACAAVLIGLSLGMLGGGGSILTVPVFVYLLGYAAKPAIAMSLPVVGITSFAGALGHLRAGNLHLRTAIPFGAATMMGAYLGARLSVFVSGTAQLVLLSLIMMASAISMFRSSMKKGSTGTAGKGSFNGNGEGNASTDTSPSTDTVSAPSSNAPSSLAIIVLVGFFVGMLTGTVGVGGGFLIVPALVLLARVSIHQAIGTSLLVISVTTAAGYAGYAGRYDIPWQFLAIFAAIAVSGSLAGVALSQRVPAAKLKRSFATLLIVIGALMLYKNLAG